MGGKAAKGRSVGRDDRPACIGSGEYPYGYAPTLHFSPDGEQLVGVNDMTLLVWPVPKLGEPRLVRND